MELWDILDENGKLTGRKIRRGEKLKQGEYHLVVHIWIINDKGELLIQKRADSVQLWPGMWAITGGSAVAGEDSVTAAVRETKEELGIEVCNKYMNLVERIIRSDSIVDIWLIKKNINLDELHVQAEEVSEAKWVTKEKLIQMQESGQFLKYSYIPELFEKIYKN